MKHILIPRKDGTFTMVRHMIESASEDELTEHEQIINELYSKNPPNTKLYYFNPNNYGEEYFTLAHSPTQAMIHLKNYLKTKINDINYGDIYQETYNCWEKTTPDNLPLKYTLELYDVGEVIESELA